MQEYTILQLQAAMQSGDLTARAITEMYLARIRAVDVLINAVIEINPDALAIADALDAERAAGQVRGPLHGIPILIKDNIDTHDKMQTTAGSLALVGSVAPRDAFIVERLRAAGAVLLGKTNLSEWANFRGVRSISGWSSRGGQTRNPYALDRSPSGSSSGSGAAVAANLCAAAIGTETDGSITSPAHANGIVGIKPTLGLLSRSGIIPIAHSQDTAGPMARSVTDAALLLSALTGYDPRDPATAASAGNTQPDYAAGLTVDGLRGARIGVTRNMAGSDARVLALLEKAIALIKDLGAEVIDPADLPNFDKFGPSEIEVLLYEFKADLDAYLSTRSDARVRSMADVVAFNEAHRDQVLQFFGQERMTAALKKGPLTQKRYLNALAKNHRLTRQQGIDAALAKHNLDALITPTGGPAWLIDPINGDSINWDIESTSPPAVAGYPHLTVPMGYVHGLPIGLSFIGAAWQEAKLIRYAYAFEQAAQVRVPPQFLPTADLPQVSR